MTSERSTGSQTLALRILIGDRALHVPLEAVEVVVRTPKVTPVPGTPPALAGLFNHEGAVYPAVHPIEGRCSADRHAVVVRTHHHGRFALLCDWAEELADPHGGEPCLDLDALAGRVIAAYREVEPVLPRERAAGPRALIRLRRRSRGAADAGPAEQPP
ncbi:MAG TPA: chemotaxis protein CheW [Chloroflexota bacterium]|jgi:hypothetical protein|nr:chemotaxis protein CheW [Chloroflexota bacterium]